MNTFKAGDQVYCPTVCSSIMTLEPSDDSEYSLQLKTRSHGPIKFTINGLRRSSDVALILHATCENKGLLEKLFGVEFETNIKLVDVKLPLTFKPEVGDTYWMLEPHSYLGYSSTVCELESGYDQRATENGVWRTEEEVALAVEQLRAIKHE